MLLDMLIEGNQSRSLSFLGRTKSYGSRICIVQVVLRRTVLLLGKIRLLNRIHRSTR